MIWSLIISKGRKSGYDTCKDGHKPPVWQIVTIWFCIEALSEDVFKCRLEILNDFMHGNDVNGKKKLEEASLLISVLEELTGRKLYSY